MKFFSFVNMYFVGIHAGIQTAHASHAMETKYRKAVESPNFDYERIPTNTKYIDALVRLDNYRRWADHYQTINVKKVMAADVHQTLQYLYDELTRLCEPLNLPTVLWKEPSANNCNTAVGVVLPSEIYDVKPPRVVDIALGLPEPYTDEQKIKQIIDSYKMAT